jgi:hypothetical protein
MKDEVQQQYARHDHPLALLTHAINVIYVNVSEMLAANGVDNLPQVLVTNRRGAENGEHVQSVQIYLEDQDTTNYVSWLVTRLAQDDEVDWAAFVIECWTAPAGSTGQPCEHPERRNAVRALIATRWNVIVFTMKVNADGKTLESPPTTTIVESKPWPKWAGAPPAGEFVFALQPDVNADALHVESQDLASPTPSVH